MSVRNGAPLYRGNLPQSTRGLATVFMPYLCAFMGASHCSIVRSKLLDQFDLPWCNPTRSFWWDVLYIFCSTSNISILTSVWVNTIVEGHNIERTTDVWQSVQPRGASAGLGDLVQCKRSQWWHGWWILAMRVPGPCFHLHSALEGFMSQGSWWKWFTCFNKGI